MSTNTRGEAKAPPAEEERESEGEVEHIEEPYGILSLKLSREAIRRNLERNCCHIVEKELVDGGSRLTVLARREEIFFQIEELRKAHSEYVEALYEYKQPTDDAYSYINTNEWMVRDVTEKIDRYLLSMQSDIDSLKSFPMSTRDDFGSVNPLNELNNCFDVRSKAVSPAPSCSSQQPLKRPRYYETDQESQKVDWIDERLSSTPAKIDSVNPMWMMNVIPQLKIEPFAGDPKEWPNFVSSFKDMIHDVLPSDSQRLAVLKQLLTSEVRSYISEHLESGSNYYDALAELRKRYGQPQVVARAHLTSLMNLPTLKDDDYSELGKFSRTLHGAMYALRTGGYEQDLEAGMTLEHVVRKLPPRMRSTWGIKVYRMTPERATLKHLAHWLDEIVMGEMMTRSYHGQPKNKNKDRQDGDATKPPPSFAAGTKPTILMTDSQSHTCMCCGRPHSISKCYQFKALSVLERAEFARDKKLCFRCLDGLHRSSECPTKNVCSVEGCGQRHHFLIHGAPRMFPIKSKELEQNNPTVNTIERLAVTTLLNVVPVILQANGKTVKTHALLDNGSDVSLISSDTVRLLQLTGKARKVIFWTFHGNNPAIQTTSVNFTIKLLDE